MTSRTLSRRCAIATGLLALSSVAVGLHAAFQQEYKSGIEWPEPAIIDAGSSSQAPSDAIVLFDGHDLLQWEGGENWTIRDGYAISDKTGITTKQGFGD